MWISEEEEARSTATAVHLGPGHHLQQQSSLQLRGVCPERAAGAGVHSRGLHGGDWSVGIIPTQASFLPSHGVLLHTLRELKLCLSLFGPYQPREEGLPYPRPRHDPADAVQPAGDGGEDVRGHVQPHGHAAQLPDLPPPAHPLHARRQD